MKELHAGGVRAPRSKPSGSDLRGGPATVPDEEIERLAAHSSRRRRTRRLPRDDARVSRGARRQPRVRAAGRSATCMPHKVPGYAIVTLSLKKTGVPPGDVTADQMDAIADLADRYSFGELRVTHEQNLILADVQQSDLLALWQRAEGARPRHAEHRPAHQHHLLPGRRLLLARQCEVDPDRRGDPAPLRRPRLPARHRRARPQHLRLHERLRPPSRRPHRHPRRRQERRGVVPGHDRRHAGRATRRIGKVIGPSFAADEMPDVVVAADRDLRRHPPRGRALRRHRAPRRHRPVQGARLCRSSLSAARSSTTACDAACASATRAGRRCPKACPVIVPLALLARASATRCSRARRRRRVARAGRRSRRARRRRRRAAADRDRLPEVHRRPRLFDRAPAARALRLSRRAARDRRRAARPALLPVAGAASMRSRCATTRTSTPRWRRSRDFSDGYQSTRSRTPLFRRRDACAERRRA